MSSGLISAAAFGRSLPPNGPALLPPVALVINTPSTTYKGSLLPVILLAPLSNTLEEEPTAPELEVTCTPEIFPDKALAMLVSLACTKASPSIS